MEFAAVEFYFCPNQTGEYFTVAPCKIDTLAEVNELFEYKQDRSRGGRIFMTDKVPEQIPVLSVQNCKAFMESLLTENPAIREAAFNHIAEKCEKGSMTVQNFMRQYFQDCTDRKTQFILGSRHFKSVKELASKMKIDALAEFFSRGETEDIRAESTIHYLSKFLLKMPETRTAYRALQFVNAEHSPVYYHLSHLLAGRAGCIVHSPNGALQRLPGRSVLALGQVRSWVPTAPRPS